MFIKTKEKLMNCKNQVSQFVPRGYGYREVLLPCGSTSIHGTTLICDQCNTKLEKSYPQGWRESPGDICPHGNYVGDAGGPDYLCGHCENGKD
jgi:hypothetical protein